MMAVFYRAVVPGRAGFNAIKPLKTRRPLLALCGGRVKTNCIQRIDGIRKRDYARDIDPAQLHIETGFGTQRKQSGLDTGTAVTAAHVWYGQ